MKTFRMSRREKVYMRKSFVSQMDQMDCGVVCLLGVIRYYGGDAGLEHLRETSGTTRRGTTLLGLHRAATEAGLLAQGLRGDLENLKTMTQPCILHVEHPELGLHYLVCYAFDGDSFWIGDPAAKVERYAPEKLDSLWKSKAVLTLVPGPDFRTAPRRKPFRDHWIRAALQEDASLLITLTVLGLIISMLGLTLSVYMQLLIDRILPMGNASRLIPGLLLVALLLGVRSALAYIRGHISNIQTLAFNNRLIGKFYGTLLTLPKSFFNSRKTGELVARMEDTQQIQMIVTYIFSEFFNDAFLVIASVGMILAYNLTIGIVMLATLSLYNAVALASGRKLGKYQRNVMASNATKTGNYVNTILGIDTIKIYNREEDFAHRNRQIYGYFQDRIFRLGEKGISILLTNEVMSLVATLGVLSLASLFVIEKKITLGMLTALISLSGNLLPRMGNIIFSNIRFQGARVALQRMQEFVGLTPEYETGSQPEPSVKTGFGELCLHRVSFAYPGHMPLIRSCTMNLHDRQTVALMGDSGCGKTTLLNLLMKFYRPDSGQIMVNGRDFSEIPVNQWRAITGVVQQEIRFFNGTLLENICLSSRPKELDKVYRFCIEQGFDPFFRDFPEGYATLLGEEGVTLSGGQQQLLAFCRALYKSPRLLLLDEPTASMDRGMEAFVLQHIRKLHHHIAILVITHHTKLARMADTVYSMQNGMITRAETPVQYPQGDSYPD